jgi:hypothetical protein
VNKYQDSSRGSGTLQVNNYDDGDDDDDCDDDNVYDDDDEIHCLIDDYMNIENCKI